MSVRREDKDPNVDGSPSSVMDKSQRWLKDLRARTSRFHEETALQIETGGRLAISEDVTNISVKTSSELKGSLNKNNILVSYLKILDQPHQANLVNVPKHMGLHTLQVTGTLSSNGIRKIIYITYKFTQIYR